MFVLQRLTVVVIGRNEGERLAACLRSVLAMRNDGWRVEPIYVDSGSTDDSVALAESLGFQAIALQTERPTAAKGRNAGWCAGTGELVLFLDGDTVLHPDFVANASREFGDSSVAVVWGHRRESHPGASIYNRVLDLDWMYQPGWTPFCGGDALFRRSALEAANGFDETLIAGEEPELCRRILGQGGRILHVNLPMTRHDLAITRWRQYWHRASRAGHAYAEIAERFRNSDNPFWMDEVKRNQRRAGVLLFVLIFGVLSTLVFRSAWPLLAMLAFYLLLAVRSAWKARWKSNSALTLLLYGIHSHLQQVPIFFGQLRFRRNQRAGLKSQLLEYK